MNRDETQKPLSQFHDDTMTCPSCGNSGIDSTVLRHSFSYGAGPTAIELVAEVPRRTCTNCAFVFLDSDAEDAKHEALCRHFGLMTPDEIRSVREMCGLSRADFAQLTRLGEATIGRWERGALLQNAAYDQFLYLLRFADNFRRLRERDVRSNEGVGTTALPQSDRRFRSLSGANLARAKVAGTKFRLYCCDEAA